MGSLDSRTCTARLAASKRKVILPKVQRGVPMCDIVDQKQAGEKGTSIGRRCIKREVLHLGFKR